MPTALVFAIALAVYAATVAPTVTLVDSGELIVAAHTLGVAHPPGFPLYVLLAHLATLVPFGNIAARVNIASAVFAAVAVGALSLTMAEVIRRQPPVAGAPRSERKGKGRKRAAGQGVDPVREDGDSSALLTVVPAMTASLLLAFSRTFWSYATIAEVYTLNTLLIALVFWLMLRWRRGRVQRSIVPRRRDGALYAAAFVFGCGLGVHHVTVGLTLPALAALVYATEGASFYKSRRLLCAALFACVGLTIYVYLPIAAAHAPVLNWGDPRTIQRLWWHITGRQFQSYFVFSAGLVGKQIADFVALTIREFGPPWLPAGLVLAGLGFNTLFRRDRALFVFLLLVIAADLAYGVSYEIAEDKAAYYLPAFVSLALAAGCGAHWVLQRAARASAGPARPLAALAILVVPMLTLAANFRYSDRHRYFIAQDYVDNLLSTIEPGGMLLTLDWQVCSPMLYVRTIERRRRDVILIDINLLRRSWYFDYLRRQYPELLAQLREVVDPFLEDLQHWEQDPALFRRDVSLNQRIDDRFNTMVLAMVSRHLRSAPVYVTQDVALSRDPDSVRLTKSLATTYQLVPQGLVFQLFADRDFHDPAAPQLATRGLVDGTLRFDADDVVKLKVLPVYVAMLYNRGRYLALHARHTRASAAFEEALAIDPAFLPARQALAESRKAAQGRPAGPE